ncbi:MAG TPA: hypothetical protein VGR85_00085 [Candidatus Limnocylindria bacterium]|jgi:hypothetical protein|nr:hypothetical protein [Candidatus Limnocylindria bacterium]
MADHGIFLGFGTPARGRENGATKVFAEFIQYLGGQQAQKNIESFEPVFLQAHGGDLGGFVLVKGEREKLDRMIASDEFDKLVTRALFVVDQLGVVNASVGGRVQKLLGSFQRDTADLRT